MNQDIVFLLERLIAELDGSGGDKKMPKNRMSLVNQSRGHGHQATRFDIGDPLHRSVRRDEMAESVTWDYGETIVDGYRGQDGGPFSDISRSLLVPRENVLGTEAVIGSDDRTKVINSNEYPWRMIVSLEMEMPGLVIRRGTGFMVGPTTVLTAGHCVYESRYGGWAEKVTIRPGLSGVSQPYGSQTSGQMSASLGWVDLEDHKYDYAFIELEEPIGERTGWFSLGVLPAQKIYNSAINVCGYPSDVNDDLLYQWHSGGQTGFVESQKLYYEADTYGGTSGGPVWVSREDGSQVVVGVHAYGTKLSEHLGKPHNSATRIVPEIVSNSVK